MVFVHDNQIRFRHTFWLREGKIVMAHYPDAPLFDMLCLAVIITTIAPLAPDRLPLADRAFDRMPKLAKFLRQLRLLAHGLAVGPGLPL